MSDGFLVCNVAYGREQVDEVADHLLSRGIAASKSQAVALALTSLLDLSDEMRHAMMDLIFDQGVEFDISKVPQSALDAAMASARRMRLANVLESLTPEGHA